MSKKNKHRYQDSGTSTASSAVQSLAVEHVEEYRFVQKDLVRLLIVNALFLAALLVVYFTNQNHQYLERLFGNVHL
jgi:hypothetical protein